MLCGSFTQPKKQFKVQIITSMTTFIVEQQHHGICVIFCMFVLNIIRFFLNKKNVLKPHQTQVMNAQNQSRFPNEKSTSTLETAYATESTQ